MSTEEWLNLIPDKYRKYARAAILDEAERAFDAGVRVGGASADLHEFSSISESEYNEIPDKETYINNLFNNDK